MLPDWTSALVAKAKIAAVMTAAVTAGGVGGTVALSHVAPAAHTVGASSPAPAAGDPESTDAGDPQTTDPQTTGAGTGTGGDPESGQAGDPQSGQAGDPGSGQAGGCAAGVRNHGAYVSGVAHAAPRGRDAAHGKPVSTAARADCGKKKEASGAGENRTRDGRTTARDGHSGRLSRHALNQETKPSHRTKHPTNRAAKRSATRSAKQSVKQPARHSDKHAAEPSAPRQGDHGVVRQQTP